MPFKDHFQTLRISHRATPQQVQKAYYDRLKLFHPDFYNDDPARRAVAEIEAKWLNEAFEVLGRPDGREEYITEWERHQVALRPPERLLALERSLVDARADLNAARLQLAELRSALDQRDRELEAANLGVRHGYQRVTHLQEAAQSFQERARQLQDRLQERDLELLRSQGRGDELERQVARLQGEGEQAREEGLQARLASREQQIRLQETERDLMERKRALETLQRDLLSSVDREALERTIRQLEETVSTAKVQAAEMRLAVAAGERALALRQSELDERVAEVNELRSSAQLAYEQGRHQQALLDRAANRIRILEDRLEREILQLSTSASSERAAHDDAVRQLEEAVATGCMLQKDLRRKLETAEETLRLRQAEVDRKTSEAEDLRQSALLAQESLREQGALLDEAARQLKHLQARLELSESELRRKGVTAVFGFEQLELPMGEVPAFQIRIRELSLALAQRTEEATQAQQQVALLEERIRVLAPDGREQAGPARRAGVTGRTAVASGRAASWLTPERGRTLLTGLMLALCVVAVMLISLTVSIDMPALAAGIGRLVPALAGQPSR